MATAPNGLVTLEVNGKSYVAGLVWKPLQSGRKYMAEAKAYGRANGMEMVAIRRGRGGVLQAGYAPKGLARGGTLYSLAAALAGQLGDNWIGVFPLDREQDRFVLASVFKGSVVAGRGDMIGGFAEIQTTLRETYSLLSSDSTVDFATEGRVIAPAAFEFASESLDLADLLKPKSVRNEYRLRPLTFGLTRQQLAIGAGGTVAAVVAVGGYSWWQDKREAAEAHRQQTLELAREQLALTQPKVELPKPWVKVPAAATVLESCTAHLDATPIALGGWLFSRADCTPDRAVTTYNRVDGTPVSQFVQAVTAFAGAAPDVLQDGAVGTVTSSVALSPAADESLQPTAQVLMALTSRIQSIGEGSAFALTPVPFEPDPENPDQPIPDWTTTGFALQTTYPPLPLFAELDLAGVRVFEVFTTLNHESAQLSWTVTGEIYGR